MEEIILYLCTRQYDLARHEDQKHDLRLDHTVDQAGEELQRIRIRQRRPHRLIEGNIPQARKS